MSRQTPNNSSRRPAAARSRGGGQAPSAVEIQETSAKSEGRYWQQRLIVRRYHFPVSGQSEADLAVCVDHSGEGCYFPLGTSDPAKAAAQALKIHRTIVESGWEETCRRFSRELMIGFEWCANPILWTYTTVHTLAAAVAPPRNKIAASRVLVVESDDGIRHALDWCLNQQTGLEGIGCGSPDLFEEAFNRHKPAMVLLNRNLAARVGFEFPGRLAPIRKNVPALTYSSAPDGDRLFVSTPGGADGYLLKRVKPDRVLEPILDPVGQPNFSPDDMPSRVRSYFKSLLQPRAGQETSALERLTPREHEVLALLSKGCVDKEIAQALGISAWTVHGHIKKIFERLHVRTRTEAVVRYLEK